MAKQRYYKELRLKQKAANERMRQLEKAGIESPAYRALQARLEVLGRQRKGSRGRRFSETGKATYNEMEIQNKILDEFLYGQSTSTVRGARQYYDNVWQSANENNNLTEAGISRDEWLNFWQSMPADKNERIYGSSQIVNIIQAYSMKNGQLEAEGKMSVEEIAHAIQNSKSLKDAYNSLGITYKDVKAARKLGAL